jgi:uncharacterized membrane protein YfcA
MEATAAHYLLGCLCGGFIGFSLGLTGGGGSLLAVPLMVYVVGVSDAHRAIGTATVAVAVNAAFGLAAHGRTGEVKWSCAAFFAGFGVAGALLGSLLGKSVSSQQLLFLFALLMLAAAVMLVRRRHGGGDATVCLTRHNAPKLAGIGFVTGGLSGFFGIGGGFLIVPGLILATGMPVINAVGTSLASVTAFATTTAASYAASGWVDWPLAGVFIAGGMIGGFGGATLAGELALKRGALNIVFAALMAIVAVYMLIRSSNAV